MSYFLSSLYSKRDRSGKLHVYGTINAFGDYIRFWGRFDCKFNFSRLRYYEDVQSLNIKLEYKNYNKIYWNQLSKIRQDRIDNEINEYLVVERLKGNI